MNNQYVCANGDFAVDESPFIRKGTTKNTQLGTYRYMSPEIILGETETGEGDFWALGVILFSMQTGSHPFEWEDEENNYGDICDNIIDYEVNWEKLIKSKVEVNLFFLIQQLLAYDKNERITSIEKFKQHRYFQGIFYFINLIYIGFDWENVYKIYSPLCEYSLKNLSALNEIIKSNNSAVSKKKENKIENKVSDIVNHPKRKTYSSMKVDNLHGLNNAVIKKNLIGKEVEWASSDNDF